MTTPATRLAPSPTGTLHLGNVRTFLITWALARSRGWRIVMRMEDLDRQRVQPDDTEVILDSIRWLGMDFDEGPYVQSADLEPYRQAMRNLATQRTVFACALTRKQIQAAASAPHRDDGELRFPPDMRPADDAAFTFAHDESNHRFVVQERDIDITDAFAGTVTFNPHREGGDFVIWTRLGVPAYQLAVVVDDARQGITDVVRGDDLLASATRQSLIYRALGLTEPRWWHLPLVLGPDGRRLAKRQGDSQISTYRAAGIRPERIIGLMAHWCNITAARMEMSANDFLQAFDIATLSRSPVTFTADDHQWLMHAT